MDVMQVLHMNGGTGKTSDANNSFLQRRVISMTRPIIEEAMTDLYLTSFPSRLVIADLGCSSGPNTFFVISQLIKTVKNLRMNLGRDDLPEYQIFLNDLPGNDFNAVFIGIRHVPKVVECNNSNICIASSSPKRAMDAYYKQFQSDFSVFPKSRAEEVISGGRMVLTMLGRKSQHPSSEEERCCVWELVGMALDEMVMEGLMEEGKLDSFNIPLYMPSPAELKSLVLKEGSFSINRLEVSEVSWGGSSSNECNHSREEGYKVAMCMRAIAESILISHFGQGIVEEVFNRYKVMFEERMTKEKIGFTNLTISLTRM